MCDDNTSVSGNANEINDDDTDSTATQTDDNGTDSDEEQNENGESLVEKLEKLKKMLAMQEEQEEEWNPKLNFSSAYIGNGFINLTITECNSSISQFELKYCFHNNINENELTFQTFQFSPRKLDNNTLLIRIPQRLTDYFFTFEFRGYAQQQQQTSITMAKWTEYSPQTSIFIPFDAPQYQFKSGEIVHFQQPNNPFWSVGRIIKISDDNVADILYKEDVCYKEDEFFKIAVDNLKFKERYRNKLIDLTDWMELSKQLLLNGKDKNVQSIYVLLCDILESNIHKWIFESNHKNDQIEEEERMSCIDLIFLGDIEQDITCCCRFIALNVVKFLDENNIKCRKNENENDYDIIDNNISIACGLCPIKSHYKTKSRLRNVWHSKMLSISAYGKGKEQFCDLVHMLEKGVGTMCDICLIGFHHMSYLYVCSSSLEQQHDICVPCMNRNVLQYKRLQKTLNDLYFIHELDHYCVSHIVYCLVGWVSLND